jgi:hypothetical protein
MLEARDQLPDDIGALKAMVLHWSEMAAAKDAALAEKDAQLTRVRDANARLWETLRQLRHAQFGRKSEKLYPDQPSAARAPKGAARSVRPRAGRCSIRSNPGSTRLCPCSRRLQDG